MTKRFVVTLLGIVVVVALALSALSQESQAIEGREPIGYIGHGAIFDADGNEINVTPQFIREAQQWYLDFLYRQAAPNERALFAKRKKQLFEEGNLRGQSELLANSALLLSLLDQVKPRNACELAGKLRMLENLLRTRRLSPLNQPISPRYTEGFQLSSEVQERLKAVQESIAEPCIAARGTSLDGVNYIKECEAAGVPIPPDWGDPLWINKGVLADEDEFIKPSYEAEVFAYNGTGSAPEGACIALPRYNGDTIELLGIICLGKRSSKACFWDIQTSVKKGENVPLTSFVGGPALDGIGKGVCTGCHAGENPFILHPGTALGLPKLGGFQLKADDFYKPLVSSNWPQNPGPSMLLDSVESKRQCTECHRKGGNGGRFPNVSTATEKYCASVLEQAIQRTMPPDLPGDPRYANHANALLEACEKAP